MQKIKSRKIQQSNDKVYVPEAATNSHSLIAHVACPLKLSQKQSSTLDYKKIKKLRLAQNMFAKNTFEMLAINNRSCQSQMAIKQLIIAPTAHRTIETTTGLPAARGGISRSSKVINGPIKTRDHPSSMYSS